MTLSANQTCGKLLTGLFRTSSEVERTSSEIGAKLDRTSSKVGLNFERSWTCIAKGKMCCVQVAMKSEQLVIAHLSVQYVKYSFARI